MKVCQVCRTMLDSHQKTPDSPIIHKHSSLVQDDHEPVPVDPSEMDEIYPFCDFCSEAIDPPEDTWTFPCETFNMPGTNATSVGAWAACEPCKESIEEGDLDEIASRAKTIQGVPSSFRPEARGAIMLLWRLFMENRTGDPYHGMQNFKREDIE